MGRTGVLQEIRMLRFEEIHDRFTKGRLSAAEAAEWLGVSERTFRRQRARYDDEGLSGLLDRRLGKVSPHRVPADEVERVVELYRTRYAGWTVKHFHEHLVERHGMGRSYGWTKSVLHASGLVRPAVKRSAHRRKRPRRPVPGMMLHQDGSRHLWVPALGRQIDLIVTLDDATSEIYSAFLVEEEGTASTFQGLLEVFQAHGLPCALYTDRGSHYFQTPDAGGKVNKATPTQLGRALAQLGVEHIAAYSPEARGRSERMFGTLQDRLVREMADAGITTLAAANRFLRRSIWPITTPASRWSRPSRARRSCRSAGPIWRTSCATRRSAWSATTTPCASSVWCFRSCPVRCAPTSSRPPCGSTATPTTASRCSMARAASAGIGPTAPPKPRRWRTSRRRDAMHRQAPTRTSMASARGDPQGRCAPLRGGLRPSLTATARRCPAKRRSGRRDGPADRTEGYQ